MRAFVDCHCADAPDCRTCGGLGLVEVCFYCAAFHGECDCGPLYARPLKVQAPAVLAPAVVCDLPVVPNYDVK